jgi:hypothetical protein
MARIIISNVLLVALLGLLVTGAVIGNQDMFRFLIMLAAIVGMGWLLCSPGEHVLKLRTTILILVIVGEWMFLEPKKDTGRHDEICQVSPDSLSVGDFVKINGEWYLVKKIQGEKIWVAGAGFDTRDFFNLMEIKDFRKQGSPDWDSLATNHLKLKVRWLRF